VGDVTKVHLRGFSLMPYFDKVGGCDATGENGELTITGQTDRVYRTMLGNVVIDPVLRRRIGTTKIGSNHTVVWNPWVEKAKAMSEKPGDFGEDEWQKMLCVEAANAEPLEVGPNNAIGLISELAVSAL
jgi:glucose-6-phosphate 1-epimerase